MPQLSDPLAERDALILLTCATFIGCAPVLPHLPEKNRDVLNGAFFRAFDVLGLDRNDEARARLQLVALLRETEARRVERGTFVRGTSELMPSR